MNDKELNDWIEEEERKIEVRGQECDEAVINIGKAAEKVEAVAKSNKDESGELFGRALKEHTEAWSAYVELIKKHEAEKILNDALNDALFAQSKRHFEELMSNPEYAEKAVMDWARRLEDDAMQAEG